MCKWILALAVSLAAIGIPLSAAEYRLAESIEIDKVPSWFPVGFCLLTHGRDQYVAYYNDQHQMMVASRRLSERSWRKVELPSKIGWDSHNYVTMAIDSGGYLHLSGNMHVVPLIYFRTGEPGDIRTFEKRAMTGEDEGQCTYPRFLYDAEGQLLFSYRSGRSGSGKRIYNHYDVATQTWSRFLRTPLFDGQGQRNAYPVGPVAGGDGDFHVAWVWRDTPDCATNHDLSYARSSDLKDWRTADGKPLRLPLTLAQESAVVDPVPVGGGIINSGVRLAFDSKHRPFLAYHKRDGDGHMQIYVAGFRDGRWAPQPVTCWKKEIPFGGGGSMPFIGIRISQPTRVQADTLMIEYQHRDYGKGKVILDEETLQPVDRLVTLTPQHPSGLGEKEVPWEGIRVNTRDDIGGSDRTGEKYLLRWETLGPHRDKPREPPLPPASTLRVIKLVK
jgi:hypothetical protein